MSKQENENAGKGRGREWSASFKRTIKGYTMPDLVFKSETIEGTLPFVAKTLEDGINRLGLTTDEIILALNTTAKNKMIASKAENALGPDAVPEYVLNKFIETLKSIPRIAALNPNGDKGTAAEKKAVLEACIAKIKADADLLASLNVKVAESKEEDADKE